MCVCGEGVYKCASPAYLPDLCCLSNDPERFQQDLLNISRTTLSSKLLTHHKEHFSQLAVDAVLRLKGSGNLDAIHVIKKLGGSLTDSYLDEGLYWAHQGRMYWGGGCVQRGSEPEYSWELRANRLCSQVNLLSSVVAVSVTCRRLLVPLC